MTTISFSTVKVGTNQHEWANNKNICKNNALNIIGAGKDQKQKKLILKVVDNIQRNINKNTLDVTVIETQAELLLKQANVEPNKIYELLNDIIVMSRHNTTSDTKINWFGCTYKTATITYFIKDINKSKSVLNDIDTISSASINEIASSLISAAVAEKTKHFDFLLVNVSKCNFTNVEDSSKYSSDIAYILNACSKSLNQINGAPPILCQNSTINITEKVEFLKNLSKMSSMQSTHEPHKTNMSQVIQSLYDNNALKYNFDNTKTLDEFDTLLSSYTNDSIIKALLELAISTGVILSRTPTIPALMKIITTINQSDFIIFKTMSNNQPNTKQNSDNKQNQGSNVELTINRIHSNLSFAEQDLLKIELNKFQPTNTQSSSEPNVDTINNDNAIQVVSDDEKDNSTDKNMPSLYSNYSDQQANLPKFIGNIENTTQHISNILGLYDISEDFKNIYQPIIANINNIIKKTHATGNNFPIQKRLVIYSINSKQATSKRIDILDRSAEIAESLKNPEIFNITINKPHQSDTPEIIITPSKKHYLLKDNTWDKSLNTYGVNKKLKTSLKINLGNNVDVGLCMKISKRSKPTKSGATYIATYIEYKGVSFLHKNLRKQFIEDALGKTKDFANLHNKIKYYYDTTLKRKIQDPKTNNVLYNPESKEIIHIDIDNPGRTNIAITNLLEYLKEDYPQAAEASLKEKNFITTHINGKHYSSTLKIIDSLNLEASNHSNLGEYAKDSSTTMITFIDITGKVLRYRKQAIESGHTGTTDEIILVNAPFNSDELKLISEQDLVYTKHNIPHNNVGQLVYDIFATRLLQKKPNILEFYKKEENKFSSEKNMSATLAPYVFCAFRDLPKLSYKGRSETAAVEMALQLYREARQYYPDDKIEIPTWLVDAINNLYEGKTSKTNNNDNL
ncbi:MAG: hypothetical protein QG673_65 [Pseudomonadota bacterium]|nr:hypothetical protein [Pseudomonadota bacterium]